MQSLDLIPDIRFEPPADAVQLSPFLACAKEEGCLLFFNDSGPILLAWEDDRESRCLAGAMLSKLELAGPRVLGEILGVNRTTIFRYRKRLERDGVKALRSEGWGGHNRGQRKMRLSPPGSG
jgi:hypothetical protein